MASEGRFRTEIDFTGMTPGEVKVICQNTRDKLRRTHGIQCSVNFDVRRGHVVIYSPIEIPQETLNQALATDRKIQKGTYTFTKLNSTDNEDPYGNLGTEELKTKLEQTASDLRAVQEELALERRTYEKSLGQLTENIQGMRDRSEKLEGRVAELTKQREQVNSQLAVLSSTRQLPGNDVFGLLTYSIASQTNKFYDLLDSMERRLISAAEASGLDKFLDITKIEELYNKLVNRNSVDPVEENLRAEKEKAEAFIAAYKEISVRLKGNKFFSTEINTNEAESAIIKYQEYVDRAAQELKGISEGFSRIRIGRKDFEFGIHFVGNTGRIIMPYETSRGSNELVYHALNKVAEDLGMEGSRNLGNARGLLVVQGEIKDDIPDLRRYQLNGGLLEILGVRGNPIIIFENVA